MLDLSDHANDVAEVIRGMTDGRGPDSVIDAIFDKQIQLRMGQANVLRFVPDLLPLLQDGDPLGVDGFATHHLPLDRGPDAYEKFQKKEDGYVKVLLQP